ncbi:MAG: 4Fe-4S dicluster domain-containing protein, partial [Deltaproteobacteria bacterium]|nr:4Fe-4S dicluster domain-containing protein [Deltaproteobacteria bacterium]
MSMDRRRFCKLAGCSALGVAGASAVATGARTTEVGAGSSPAVADPITGKRWAMVVDMQACRKETGCRDCILACHQVHNVPDLGNPKDEVKWIWKEHYAEAFPNQKHDHLAHDLLHEEVLVFCNHCDNPPCTRVCPTQATWKRDDGIVMMDWHRCIGCRYCVAACPYGSRSFNWRDPRPFVDEVDPDYPTRTRGVVEKCTFCDARLAKGLQPACVEACEHKCLIFGDLEDAGSEVRAILEKRHAIRRKPG